MEHFYRAASKELTVLWYCQPLKWWIRHIILKLQYTHHKGAVHTNMPLLTLLCQIQHRANTMSPGGLQLCLPQYSLAMREEGKAYLHSSPPCPQHSPKEKSGSVPCGMQGGDGGCWLCRGSESWSQENRGTMCTSTAADSTDLLQAWTMTNQHYSCFKVNPNILFWARQQWSWG